MNQQILDQKRTYDHSHPVVHVSSLPEFAHPGVHHWNAGHPLLPSNQIFIGFSPGECIELGLQVAAVKLGILEQQAVGELAPAQLVAEIIHIFVARRIPDRMPSLVRR